MMAEKHSLPGTWKIHDLSAHEPGPSQTPANLAPAGTFIGPEDSTSYLSDFLSSLEEPVGPLDPEDSTNLANFLAAFVSSKDEPYTQAINPQGQQGTSEMETLMGASSLAPAFQSFQKRKRTHEAAFRMPTATPSVSVDLKSAPKVLDCFELLSLKENEACGQKQNTTTANIDTTQMLSSSAFPKVVENEVSTNGGGVSAVNTGNNSWPSSRKEASEGNASSSSKTHNFLDAPGRAIGNDKECLDEMMSCPMFGCSWNGKVRCLVDHIFDIRGHREEINYGRERTFPISLDTLRKTKYRFIVQQTFSRVFGITVALRERQIFVFAQEIPTYTTEEMKPAPVKVYLEIYGKNDFPYSWNGEIGFVYDPISTTMQPGRCLHISIGEAAFDDKNCVNLFSMLTR